MDIIFEKFTVLKRFGESITLDNGPVSCLTSVYGSTVCHGYKNAFQLECNHIWKKILIA